MEKQGASAKQDLPPLRGDIAFEDIVFRYKPGGQEVMRDLSLKISAGNIALANPALSMATLSVRRSSLARMK